VRGEVTQADTIAASIGGKIQPIALTASPLLRTTTFFGLQWVWVPVNAPLMHCSRGRVILPWAPAPIR
jgi:hypothetical protein